MMNPGLFTILKNESAVTALFGSNPVRIYPWGNAPEKVSPPYAVYSVYNGIPENYLDRVPDIDRKGTQINIYAKSPTNLEDCFEAIRDAVEPYAYLTSFSNPDRDAETMLYSCRMEFDFIEPR